MKKIYCTSLLFLFITLRLSAQSGGMGMWLKSAEKQGDWYFDNYAYQDAVDAYQKAWQKNSENDQLKLKIAESFRVLNKPAEAEKWYAKVVAKDSVFQPAHYLHFADALSSSGKYQDAQLWYLRYQEVVAEDRRVAAKIAGSSRRKEMEEKNASALRIAATGFNTSAAEFSPAFYQNGLVFVSGRASKTQKEQFVWDKSAFLDLYFTAAGDTVAPVQFSEQINSPYHEGPMVFYAGNNKLIFTRNNYLESRGKSRDGVTKLKLYYSEKKDSVSWTTPEVLPFNSDEFSTGHPAITRDGSVLYFASDRPGGYGGTDLYKVEFREGKWQEPLNLGPQVNTEGNEMFPFLYDDRELYFASNGHAGLGGLDIFGTDLSLGGAATIINLGAPLNSRFDDFGFIVDQAGTGGYFSSNRQEGAGNDDIYSFRTSKPLLSSYLLTGRILDADTRQALAGAKVQLQDSRNKPLETYQAEEDGSYSFEVEAGLSYQLLVEKEGYLDGRKKLITLQAEGPEWIYDLSLQKNYGYSLYALIRDEATGTLLEDVKVSMLDNMSGETVLQHVTPATGDFVYGLQGKKPKDRISFQIRLSKEGYLGKTITFNAALEGPGQILLHEQIKVSLTKVDIGVDIGKLADVKPIYFDLGKFSIRPDAATELDKIVSFMNENPNISIELGSHTDARGSSSSNLQLSGKRAKASVDYIVSKGIHKSRIVSRGYGESEIINQCVDGVSCSEEDHQQNRRTEFKITKL